MPETALGLFPDIGASYFLSRLPGFFGNDSYILDLHISKFKYSHVIFPFFLVYNFFYMISKISLMQPMQLRIYERKFWQDAKENLSSYEGRNQVGSWKVGGE